MIKLSINGQDLQYDGDPDMPLLWYLRDIQGLTGTKFGCGMALCGACTVHLDGVAARSCQTALGDAADRKVTTIEGLSSNGMHPVQVAWRELNVAQCGYCQGGQIMQAASLLKEKRNPSDDGHRRRDERQHLPLRHLHAHSRGGEACRQEGRRPMTHVRTSTPLIANLSRRAVLAGSVAGGLVLAMRLPQSALAQTQKFAGEGMPNGLRDDPRIFVAIAEDGTVTVTCHRSDMGQGVRTSWPMVIADELDADWAKIKVAQAWGDEQHFGNQDTDGSRSMRHHFAALRRIGAAVRQMLEAAAAAQWNVPVDQVAAQNHEVVHAASNRRLGYGALAKAAAGMAVPTGSRPQAQGPVEIPLHRT